MRGRLHPRPTTSLRPGRRAECWHPDPYPNGGPGPNRPHATVLTREGAGSHDTHRSAEREGFEPPGPRERAGCFQGSCNKPDSATAPSPSVSRSVTDLRCARHSLIRYSAPCPSRMNNQSYEVLLRALDNVPRRVRVDTPKVALPATVVRDPALNPPQRCPIVDDEIVGSRLGQRNRVVPHRGKGCDGSRRGMSPLRSVVLMDDYCSDGRGRRTRARPSDRAGTGWCGCVSTRPRRRSARTRGRAAAA